MSIEPKFVRWALLVCIVVSVLANAATWLVVLKMFPITSPAAILHYNTSVGIDFIGEGSEIKVIPLIGTALLGSNLLLSFLLRRASKAASSLFWAGLPLIEVVLLASLFLILRLNAY